MRKTFRKWRWSGPHHEAGEAGESNSHTESFWKESWSTRPGHACPRHPGRSSEQNCLQHFLSLRSLLLGELDPEGKEKKGRGHDEICIYLGHCVDTF